MIYYPMQLVVCAWLAKRCMKVAQAGEKGMETEPVVMAPPIEAVLPEQVL